MQYEIKDCVNSSLKHVMGAQNNVHQRSNVATLGAQASAQCAGKSERISPRRKMHIRLQNHIQATYAPYEYAQYCAHTAPKRTYCTNMPYTYPYYLRHTHRSLNAI